MSSFLQDLRAAIRNLRTGRHTSLIVIGILALGIAATTMVFSVIDSVLLNPFPYRDAGRPAGFRVYLPNRNHIDRFPISTFGDFRDDNHIFEAELSQDASLGSDAIPGTVLARPAMATSEQGDIYEQLVARSSNQDNFSGDDLPDQDSSVCQWPANLQLSRDVRALAPRVVSGLLDAHSCVAREQYRSLLVGTHRLETATYVSDYTGRKRSPCGLRKMFCCARTTWEGCWR